VRERLGLGARGAVGRLAQAQFIQEFLEPLAVFGDVDGFGAGADDGYAVGFQRTRKLQGRLATVLDDHAERLFLVDDLQHVFERERLKIEAIRRVVVGGHRLRVAVDHDGLKAVLAQRQRGVHAAVVELFARRGLGFALFLVSRIQVRGTRGKFRRAGIDALVDRAHVVLVARTLYWWRSLRTSDSEVSSKNASLRSEKPRRFNCNSVSASKSASVFCSSASSMSTMSLICARNHGSMRVS